MTACGNFCLIGGLDIKPFGTFIGIH